MAIKAERSFSLADQIFNADSVGQLANALSNASKPFDKKRFLSESLKAFPDLEFKDRIRHMVDRLDAQLPGDYGQAVKILEASLPAPLDPTLTDDDFGHFIWSIPAEWVALNGCTEDRLDTSLSFLKEATKRFSVENAIRPFLAGFPDHAMAFIRTCATDDNYHVRRLASEGIRPFLPWAQRVLLPPQDVVDVLTIIHADPTRYVTRSIANTLNDLSRDHPDLVITTLQSWTKAAKQSPEELDWMTRHALRTLVKSDNHEALELLGYPSKPKFSLTGVSINETVTIGDALHWRGVLKSSAQQKLKVALRIHYLKANGDHTTKVFAVKDINAGKESLEIEKKIPFKPITTRTLYLGTHHVELVVNGQVRGKRSFELIDK